MVTPVFRGTFGTIRAENAVRDLVAAMEYAQTRAITDAKEYRMYIAPEQNAYWLEQALLRDGGSLKFERLSERPSLSTTLPDSVRMATPKARKDKTSRRHYIAFYPTGLCDTSTLSLFIPADNARYSVTTTGTRVQWKKVES